MVHAKSADAAFPVQHKNLWSINNMGKGVDSHC